MSVALADFTERLVPISDFSQGKAGKIFSDVFDTGREYIVLKNNQPTAVVMSVHEYRELQRKLDKFEKLLESIENARLLSLAESRTASETNDFTAFLADEGLDLRELEDMVNDVEFE